MLRARLRHVDLRQSSVHCPASDPVWAYNKMLIPDPRVGPSTRALLFSGERHAMSDRAPKTASIDDWQKAATKSAGSPEKLVWHTPEGIDVKPLYTRRRSAGPAVRRHAARLRALRARPAGDDVRGAAVDDPPVRRLLDRRGVERLLPAQRSPPAGRASRSPSTSPRTAATTPTIRASSATSARPAWRSTRSRT